MYLGFGSSRLFFVNKALVTFLVLYSSALNQELSIRTQFTFVFLIRYLPHYSYDTKRQRGR